MCHFNVDSYTRVENKQQQESFRMSQIKKESFTVHIKYINLNK